MRLPLFACLPLLLCSTAAATLAAPTAATRVQDKAVIADLIARGRVLLDAGKADEAQVLFEQADGESGGDISTRIWVLRSWMDQARINDAFNEIDRLRDKGAKGTGVNYVYGMGSYRRALRNQAEGMNNAIAYAFGDAVQFLGGVLKEDPQTYYDAWVPLAHASWASKEYERGRDAATSAIEADPKDGQAHFWLGRNQFMLYQQSYAEDPEAPAGKELIQATAMAFDRAAELTPKLKEHASSLHQIELQRGFVALWRKRPEDSHKPFTEAIGWEPSSVDYGMLFGSLQDEEGKPGPFVQVLTRGQELFEERWGTKSSSDATLLWWLGYGQATLGEHADAETSYLAAVEKWPAYADSWWYAGRSRYFQENYVGAVEAWAELFQQKPEVLVQMINTDPQANIEIVRYANAKANAKMLEGDWSLNIPMAKVAEAVVSAHPGKAEHWNDVGLFSRDAGAHVFNQEEDGSAERAQAYWERSWAAYQKAIELAPTDAAYLNDGAVVLHYNLKRDLDKAEDMYKRAMQMAQEQLDAGTVTDEVQLSILRTARKDAEDNLKALQKEREGAGK